jgi:hypothetical protein
LKVWRHAKVRGEDSDQREGPFAENEVFPNQCHVRAEAALPQGVAYDDYLIIFRLIFFVIEKAALNGLHAEHLKETCRDTGRDNPFGHSPAGEIMINRGGESRHLLEALTLFFPIYEVGGCNRVMRIIVLSQILPHHY